MESLYVCETDTGAVIHQETDGVSLGVRFACSGKVLALHQSSRYWSKPGSVRLWDTTGWRELGRLPDIQALDSSRDGKILVTGGDDGMVRLWDAATGGKKLSIPAHLDAVRAVAFSPDGKWVASAGGPRDNMNQDPEFESNADRSVRLWDVETGKLVRFLEPPETFVRSMRFSPDGRSLLGEDDGGTTSRWAVPTGKVLRRFSPPNASRYRPSPLAFSPDGRMLVASADHHEVRFLDAADGTELRRWPDEIDDVYDLKFTPDGKTLLLGGYCLRCRDAEGKERPQFIGHRRAVHQVTFTPDGRFLSSVAEGGELQAWSPDGSPLLPLDGQESRIVHHGFGSDGNELIAVELDGTVRLRQLPSGRETRRFRVHPPSKERVYAILKGSDFGDRLGPLQGNGYVFGPGGRTLVTLGADGKLDICDVATGRCVARCDALHSGYTNLVFTPSGRTLVSEDDAGTVHLWNTTTGAELAQQLGDRMQRASFSLSPDGRLLAWGQGGAGHLIDATSGKEVRQLREWRGGILDRDGRTWIETAERRAGLLVRDLHSDIDLRRLSPPKGLDDFSHVYFFSGPDGQALASCSLGMMCQRRSLRQAATGRELCVLDVSRGDCFALSPDGRFLATAEDALILREMASGQELGRFPLPHRGTVTALTFSPDGRMLATGGSDGVILLWDWATAIGLAQPQAKRRDLLWHDLAADARTAQRAVSALSAEDDTALPFLTECVRTLGDEDEALQRLLRRLLADLNSDDFDERQRASGALAEVGAEAEPLLRRVLTEELDLEVRRRVEVAFNNPRMTQPTPAGLRRARVVQILERIGSPAASRLLRTLAEGQPDLILTQEARAALIYLGEGAHREHGVIPGPK